jgi:hypothetical protein
MKLVALVVMVSGCLMTRHFGAGKTASEAQHEQAASMTPPALVADDEWTGKVEVEKIRVWADDDFRAQNVHWRQAFDEQLGYANEILAATFGVRLEAEYREWSHHAPGDTLDAVLRDLHELDDGNGVFTVIGLTSSLPLVASSFETIGMACTPGRHVVLRGYADVFERQAFDRAFHELKASEREAMYAARRKHKTATVLLHELGHNFGAPHTDEADTIMNPSYAVHASAFDPKSRDLIRTNLAERLHRASPVVATKAVAITHPSLVIMLDAAGTAHIGGQPVDDTMLDQLMKMSFDDDHETEVIVRAPRETPQAAVVNVLDRAKAAGLHRMTLAR